MDFELFNLHMHKKIFNTLKVMQNLKMNNMASLKKDLLHVINIFFIKLSSKGVISNNKS